MIKLLIGGSPCTYWSIAKKNNRETEPSGIGWGLFENYIIAKDKFKPDFFLYENNKSAAQPIKDEIKKRLNVWDGTLFMEDTGARYIEINSALVSAQNRQRFYVHNCGEVEQPKDRGILLKDILETGVTEKEKSYTLKTHQGDKRDYFIKQHNQIAFEPICLTKDCKCHAIKAQYAKNGIANFVTNGGFAATAVAEPVCLNSKSGRVINGRFVGDVQPSLQDRIYSIDGKLTAVTTSFLPKIAEPVRIGTIENETKRNHDSKQYRVYSPDGKSTTLCGNGGGIGAKTGLYATPCNEKKTNVYEVENGQITIKGKKYPIKLKDGYYIIRKLTPIECERLQTLPDNYTVAVSDTQRYKGLGNGWTAEVIIHILNEALKDIPRDEKIVVLSMYDGIGTGRYCLDKMGFKNIEYHAFEIDKYAIKVAMSNYPDIIQHGDAYQVRKDNFKI